MGVDALRAAMEEQARNDVAALLDEARAKAQALRDAAAEQASARLSALLRDEEAKLRVDRAERIAAARRAARARALEARDALLERVFALASDQLPATLDTPAARQAMVELAEQAIRHIASEQVVVACSSELAASLQEAFANRDEVRVEPDPEMPCGFRAHGPDDAIIVDATLMSQLERRRPMLAIEVLRRAGRRGAP